MTARFYPWLVPVLCWLAISTTAPAAADSTKRVVVLEFEGRGAPAVRGHVISVLKQRDEVEVVPAKEAEAGRTKAGVSWGSADSYQRVGAELGVSAFVEGEVHKVGQKWRATIRVRDASTGLVSQEESWTRKSLPQLDAIENNFWQVLGPAITASAAPPAPEQKAVAPTPAASATAPSAAPEPQEPVIDPNPEPREVGPKSTKHPALIVWGGPRLLWRTLGYNQDTTLSNYQNTAGSPAFDLTTGGQWFPGAHKRGDWLSNFGIESDIDYSIGLKSKNAEGKSVSTTQYQFQAGALYRIPLDTFELRVRTDYLKQVFATDSAKSVGLPDVDYNSIKWGIGSAIYLVEWLNFDFNAAFLQVFHNGQIGQQRFAPKLATHGWDIGGAIVSNFKKGCGMRLGVDFQRYVLNFGKNPDGMYKLPHEGYDHYLRTTIAFVYKLRGVTKR